MDRLQPVHRVLLQFRDQFLRARIAVVDATAARPRFPRDAEAIDVPGAGSRFDRLVEIRMTDPTARGHGQQETPAGLDSSRFQSNSILAEAAALATGETERGRGSNRFCDFIVDGRDLRVDFGVPGIGGIAALALNASGVRRSRRRLI